VIHTSLAQWPLVVTTFGGAVSAAEIEEYLASYEEILRRGQRCAGLVIVEDLRPWESAAIQRQAAWIKKHERELRRISLGVAMVFPTLWLKGLLRAILWIQPMPQPYAVCSTVPEAMAWIGERLRLAGLDGGKSTSPVPPPPG
jgi:hypothetical protein